MFYYLIFGITYSFTAVVQPGPFQAFLFSQSITNGWRKTFPLVFAPLISDLPVIILVLFVLTNMPHEVLWILQSVGGLFLLYLSFNAYKAWHVFHQNEVQEISPQRNVLKAAMVNILNPNPYLAWSLILGPLLIKGWNESPANGIILLLAFYSFMVIFSIAMIVLFSAARSLGPRISRVSIAFSALALALFGLYQLGSGIKEFL
jgi:threonine/homoserine/homoserine lactone efflux protein